MSRPARLEFPGAPLHIVQRGNNRADCFFGDIDRRFYLKCLARSASRAGCAIHAYVLMTNHVHLLVTPQKSGAAGAMLQDMGRRYVRVINTLHGRTGTLWEGRFKSSVVDSERYLMACHRYIELNPVRAGLARHPAFYPWSSHAHYSGSRPDKVVTPHPAFLALGASPDERHAAFRDLFVEDLDAATLAKIREATNAGCVIGAQPPKRGRPGKARPDGQPTPVSGKLL